MSMQGNFRLHGANSYADKCIHAYILVVYCDFNVIILNHTLDIITASHM